MCPADPEPYPEQVVIFVVVNLTRGQVEVVVDIVDELPDGLGAVLVRKRLFDLRPAGKLCLLGSGQFIAELDGEPENAGLEDLTPLQAVPVTALKAYPALMHAVGLHPGCAAGLRDLDIELRAARQLPIDVESDYRYPTPDIEVPLVRVDRPSPELDAGLDDCCCPIRRGLPGGSAGGCLGLNGCRGGRAIGRGRVRLRLARLEDAVEAAWQLGRSCLNAEAREGKKC